MPARYDPSFALIARTLREEWHDMVAAPLSARLRRLVDQFNQAEAAARGDGSNDVVEAAERKSHWAGG